MQSNISLHSFYLGDWCIIPEQCRIQNSDASHHIQPKLMDVLLYLAERPAYVVSADELIEACWMGQPMTDNPIHKSIAQLRKALGDCKTDPKYIKTIPRKGYVLIAEVSKFQTISSQHEPYWCEQAPFLGNQVFQAHHHRIFFGRQQPLADLMKYIERIDQQDDLMINLSGVSGCGKSSFIQAGVIPQLLNPYKPFNLKFVDAIVWQVSESNSVQELLQLLVQKGVFKSVYSSQEIYLKLTSQSSDITVCLSTNESRVKQRIVLFIDQIEKWLNNNGSDQFCNQKIQSLLELMAVLNLSRQFFILFSARDEACKWLRSTPAFKPLSDMCIDFRLPPMQAADHKTWVQSTMQAAGLFFEINPNRHETLLDLLLSSIERHQCRLATIQTVMLKLYERKEGSKLKYANFHALGGLEGIINQYCESVFNATSSVEQLKITDSFKQLVSYKSIIHAKPVTQHIPWSQAVIVFGSSLLNHLLSQRILFSAQVNEEVLVSFYEPRVAALWGRLGQWVKDNKNQLLHLSEFQFMTARWLYKNKGADYLMTSKDLQQFKQIIESDTVLNEDDHQFCIDSNLKARRGIKFRRWWQACLLVMMLVVVGLFVLAVKSSEKSQQLQQQLTNLIEYLSTALSPELKAQGQLSLLESTNLQLLEVLQVAANNTQNQQHTRANAATLNVLGELSFNQRKPEQAYDYFSQSEILTKQSGALNNPDLLGQLILSQYWLGFLCFADNQYHQADMYWQAYLQTTLHLQTLEPNNENWQLEHSYALNNLGSLNEKTGALQAAADYFAESIAIKQRLLLRQPENMSLQADLADSLSWQGNIYRKQGALSKALDAYQSSVEMTQQMNSSNDLAHTKLHRESLALHRLASLIFDMGDVVDAHQLALASLEKSLLLNQLDQQNNDYKTELVSLHLFNAHIYRHLLDFDASLKHIQKANQLIDYFKINLTVTSKIATYQMWLKREQAAVFNHFGQVDSAITALEDGLTTWQDYSLQNNQLAQVVYVMLHLNLAQMINHNHSLQSQSLRRKNAQNHSDKAWHEVNLLLSQRPNDHQLMAINLAIALTRSDQQKKPQFIQALVQSEYRNPEYYQPLVDNQLISFN